MNGLPRRVFKGGPMAALGVIAAIAGLATAAFVGVAMAKTFALEVAKNANVTSQTRTTKTESIVVTASGRAVYTLTGDSPRHPECTKASGCFTFWPPVTVSSAKKLSKAPGIRGKLGVWHRNGFFQVTLAGHPLYRYAADGQKDSATGEGINAFGGTWHVVKAAVTGGPTPSGGTPTSTTTTTTTTMPTTTSTTCLYPPYC